MSVGETYMEKKEQMTGNAKEERKSKMGSKRLNKINAKWGKI